MKEDPIVIGSALDLQLRALAARAAGAIEAVASQPDLGVMYKDRIDPVTQADLQSEKIIVEGLSALFAGDQIIAEEGAGQVGTSGRVWYVDPLDGTVNFAHRHPPYAVTFALCVDHRPVYGLTLDVASGRIYVAAKGQGAWCDQTRLMVSGQSSLERAMLATGFPYWIRESSDRENNLEAFCSMMKVCQTIRREGSASIDLMNVASGSIDGYWEAGLKPWDIAAGILAVTEAGGVVTGLDGKELVDLYAPVVASNGKIHDQILSELNQHLVLKGAS